jgi:O-acetylhomoserine/O-acetylserine sulfhydrylase-like pyridoxal-dependent enzyme
MGAEARNADDALPVSIGLGAEADLIADLKTALAT